MRACPFCGYNEGWVKEATYQKPIKYRVECNVCGAVGPEAKTHEMAEKKWDGLLAKIDNDNKFKEALHEGVLQKSRLQDEYIKLQNEIANTVNNKMSKNSSYLEDLQNQLKYIKSQIDEEELYIEAVSEEAMGGVSTPMSTLNNTPGIGNAVPPSGGVDGKTGSGDNWGKTINKKPYVQKGKIIKKKKKKVNEMYNKNIFVGDIIEVFDEQEGIVPSKIIELVDEYSIIVQTYYGKFVAEKTKKGDWVIAEDSFPIRESNLNPYDKIGAMMAKKMGVKQPFKKKDSKTNTVTQKNFKIETLDDYTKASKHVPKHPLQKKKKINEEESLKDENNLKDVDAKEYLEKLGIAYDFKKAPSGKYRVFITDKIKDVLDILEKEEWEEVGKNEENTIRKFKKEGKILTIYADGKNYPRATITNESLIINKVVSSSLVPYL